MAPFNSQEKKTAQRLTLFQPRPTKRRPALCEFIVGGAEGGRAVAPLFGAPSSMKLWTCRVFISLCGLICLSEGSVPRCGLAPTLLSARALDSSGGGGDGDKAELKQEFIKSAAVHNARLCVRQHSSARMPPRRTVGENFWPLTGLGTVGKKM